MMFSCKRTQSVDLHVINSKLADHVGVEQLAAMTDMQQQ
jgi:hypothetical protein